MKMSTLLSGDQMAHFHGFCCNTVVNESESSLAWTRNRTWQVFVGVPRSRPGIPWWLSGKESVCNADRVQSLGQEGPLEEEMAAHSSILAWRILWAEEPGGLQCMGLQSRTRLSD